MSHSTHRIGITLITGFLGAGKSTLIRRILTEDHKLRIVVVENEFAENATVEQAIVTQGVGPAALEDFIELPNGCICCAAQDDLTDALSRLVAKKKGAFDHILIEASGLADPGTVAASFWLDEGLDSSLQLDAVVTVVDAVNIMSVLNAGIDQATAVIAQKQLACADLILLNKIDVISSSQGYPHDSQIQKLCASLRNHGCTARIITTSHCDVELSQLLNIRAYDSNTAQNQLTAPADKLLNTTHHHSSSVGSTIVTFEGVTFDSMLLDRLLGKLLWEDADANATTNARSEVWRMKALVVIEGEAEKWIYQSVHTLFDNTSSSVKVEQDEAKTSRFVFIGCGLNEEHLRTHVEGAITKCMNTK